MEKKFKVTTEILINASKEKVWEAITNPALVKQYLFGTNISSEWTEGSTIYFRGEWEGKQYEDKGIITAIKENEFLCYDYKSAWDPLPDIRENYLPIQYRLEENNNNLTTLTITQAAKTQEQANDSYSNWNAILKAMKELIEKGH